MSGLGRERVIATVNGFDADDFKTVLGLIPEALLWDELRERSDRKNKIIGEISNTLNVKLEV